MSAATATAAPPPPPKPQASRFIEVKANKEDEIKRLLTLGVDGPITDHPERVKAAL